MHIHNAKHILQSFSFHNSHPPNNKVAIVHIHLDISNIKTAKHKSMPSAIKMQSHNNSTIPHHLQETIRRKTKPNHTQNLFPHLHKLPKVLLAFGFQQLMALFHPIKFHEL
jgi:hypothetical protein